MYSIGLGVHKKTISYCVKDARGQVHQEGKIGATRNELDWWRKTLPQAWNVAMKATIFTGWIYDPLLSHASQVKVAHPVMLRPSRWRRRKMIALFAERQNRWPRSIPPNPSTKERNSVLWIEAPILPRWNQSPLVQHGSRDSIEIDTSINRRKTTVPDGSRNITIWRRICRPRVAVLWE
jgi:hypothetical protein